MPGPTVSAGVETALIIDASASASALDGAAPAGSGAGWSDGNAKKLKFHESHAPHWKGRFLWCGRCGSWSTGGFARSALVLRCTGGPSRSGASALSRIRRGLPPHSSHASWE